MSDRAANGEPIPGSVGDLRKLEAQARETERRVKALDARLEAIEQLMGQAFAESHGTEKP